MLEDFIGELGRWLGGMTGDVLSFLAKIGLYTLMVLCVWGLPWDRILSKAGFVGKTYWILFSLVFLPAWLGPGLYSLMGSNLSAMQTISEVAGFSVYGAFVFVAIAPWPIRRKSKIGEGIQKQQLPKELS